MKPVHFLVIALIFALPAPGYSQENTQKALARAQYMLKQMSAEKASLQARNVELANELESLQKKMDAELSKASKEKTKLKSNLGNWKSEYKKLKEKFFEVTAALNTMTGDRDEKAESLAMQTDNFNLCYKNNATLVDINREILNQFNQKGAWDALVQREPIIGLGEVEMENLMQTYRHDIEDMDLSFNQHLIKNLDQ